MHAIKGFHLRGNDLVQFPELCLQLIDSLRLLDDLLVLMREKEDSIVKRLIEIVVMLRQEHHGRCAEGEDLVHQIVDRKGHQVYIEWEGLNSGLINHPKATQTQLQWNKPLHILLQLPIAHLLLSTYNIHSKYLQSPTLCSVTNWMP